MSCHQAVGGWLLKPNTYIGMELYVPIAQQCAAIWTYGDVQQNDRETRFFYFSPILLLAFILSIYI